MKASFPQSYPQKLWVKKARDAWACTHRNCFVRRRPKLGHNPPLAFTPAERELLSIIQAAGWPIWPLIACSILALALIIERFMSLKTARIAPPPNCWTKPFGLAQACPRPTW
jgi:hypothetical protein